MNSENSLLGIQSIPGDRTMYAGAKKVEVNSRVLSVG